MFEIRELQSSYSTTRSQGTFRVKIVPYRYNPFNNAHKSSLQVSYTSNTQDSITIVTSSTLINSSMIDSCSTTDTHESSSIETRDAISGCDVILIPDDITGYNGVSICDEITACDAVSICDVTKEHVSEEDIHKAISFKLPSTRTCMMDAFVLCALKEWGIRLIRNDSKRLTITFEMTDFAEYFDASALLTSRKIKDSHTYRTNAIKKWFISYPSVWLGNEPYKLIVGSRHYDVVNSIIKRMKVYTM